MLAIDHAILTVPDPAATAARFAEQVGLAAVAGGRHEGHGTGNWIIPLGPSYLELMTVVDPDEAANSPLGRWVLDRITDGDQLSALCLRTDAIDQIAGRIGHEATPMSRLLDDGTVLHWRLAGLNAALAATALPFFIQWDGPGHQHPGQTTVDHRVAVDGVTWVELGADAATLGPWLGEHTLPLRIVDAPPGPRRLAIATSAGPVMVDRGGLAS